MEWHGILGFVPFVILFVGLVATKLKSYITGFSVLLITSLLAIFVWKTSVHTVGFGILEGFILAMIPILWVIFAAMFTYFLSVETGSIKVIEEYLTGITPDKNVQAVIMAFCLGGFLESVAGFGTAVAIPAAMLISLGFNPVRAAVITLVANSVPVAFGALGIPVIILSKITSLDLTLLTRYVIIQLAPFAFLVPLAILVIANGSFKGIKKSLFDTMLIGISFTIIQTAVGFLVGPELVAVSGSLGSIILYLLYKRFTSKKRTVDYRRLYLSIMNYILLLVFVLVTRLVDIPVLKVSPFTVTFSLQGHAVAIDWLTTPGTLLFVAALAGGFFQRASISKICEIIMLTVKKLAPSALTILSIVALAKVMGYSGIIKSVALTLSSLSGKAYPLIAPILGALGTFVTGSDTSSNVLLGELQKNAAVNTGYSPEWITAANTSGATAGKMISPQSISIAAATVGIKDERAIIRTTIFYCIGYSFVLGLYVFIVAKFWTF